MSAVRNTQPCYRRLNPISIQCAWLENIALASTSLKEEHHGHSSTEKHAGHSARPQPAHVGVSVPLTQAAHHHAVLQAQRLPQHTELLGDLVGQLPAGRVGLSGGSGDTGHQAGDSGAAPYLVGVNTRQKMP